MLLALLFAGCATAPGPTGPEKITTQAALIAIPARFAGTLPCADCGGIDYELTLGADHVYVLREHYEGTSPNQDMVEPGRWKIRHHAAILDLIPADSDDTAGDLWRIDSPSRITALDDNGKTIQSTLNYSLTGATPPTAQAFAGTHWFMTNAPDAGDAFVPFIVFDAASQRITGSTGCNRLMGTYHRRGQQLLLSGLASTRMICGNDTDSANTFLDALRYTRSMDILGNYLLIYGVANDPSPLAVLRTTAQAG